MSADDTGINTALLAALPASRKVLELGCADGRLGERYKQKNPSTLWIGVDQNLAALAAARTRLDGAIELSLDVDSLSKAGSGFDLIVLGDVLEHLKEPEKVLHELHSVCSPDAKLAMCMPNMSHISVIERLVFGDIMYDDVGLLDKTHLRLFSPRSVFKMLLDCGWLPSAAGAYNARHGNERFSQAIVDAALALGISQQAAEFNVYTYQLVIACERAPVREAPPSHAPVTVVVPVTNEAQMSLNVTRSPGLREIAAEIMPLRGAASAAAVCAAAAARTNAEWLLFCQQDVYLPSGSGHMIADLLQHLAPDEAPSTLVGFAGVGLDAASSPVRSGLMVDRFALLNFPATERAVSIADCAVLMHRSQVAHIDPAMGWDLWATDLCLQAIARGRPARIARIPIFWNTAAPNSLPQSFLASAQRLVEKYPALAAIATLQATISREGLRPAEFAG